MKKFFKKIAINGVLLSTLFFITGCDLPKFDFKKDDDKTITLNIGEEVEVSKGDTVNPLDESTQINIRHVLEDDKKYVTLISGSAEIIKK